jgi:hypothetical protein
MPQELRYFTAALRLRIGGADIQTLTERLGLAAGTITAIL